MATYSPGESGGSVAVGAGRGKGAEWWSSSTEDGAPAPPSGKHTTAVIALAGSLLPYAFLLAFFRGGGDQDAAIHAIFALFPTPDRVLSIWARPLFAAPYIIPAQLGGYLAMRITTIVICAVAAWLTYLVARRVGLRWAWLSIPLVLLQPALLSVGTDAMTEPIFVLVFAGGLLALSYQRTLTAAAILSFLPLARPEGPFILLVLAATWLPVVRRDRRYVAAILLLGLGMVAWLLACLVTTGNIGYLTSIPWPAHTVQVPTMFTRQQVLHYMTRWPHIIGLGLFPLWLLGLLPSWRRPLLRTCVIMTLVLLAVHTLLYSAATMGSLGLDRYLATLAPAVALVGTAGAGVLAARITGRWTGMVFALLLMLETVHALIAFDSNWLDHMPAATLAAVREAQSRVPDVSDRPLVSADQYGYVYLENGWGRDRLPPTAHDVTAATIAGFPEGTVALWDDVTGAWWFSLTIEDFTERGYRLLWERRTMLDSPLSPFYERARSSSLAWLYYWFGVPSTREMRQAVLIKE